MKVVLFLPILNAAREQAAFLYALMHQSLHPHEFLVIDSESTDDSPLYFKAAGARLQVIPRCAFNHGATRQTAVNMFPDADIIVFMTQDAILVNHDSLNILLSCFDEKPIGAVYGRQIPLPGANPIASHARQFNYPSCSMVKSIADTANLGIKTAFISNSFAAYRRSALMSVGGFPSDVIFGEDTYVAAKMLLNGWKIAYSAQATVYHSHNYGLFEEFRRYFDIGVFHSREPWFLNSLGKPEGEGKKFIFSEIRFLLRHAPWLIPSAIVRTGLKFLGYKIGQREQGMPLWLKRKLSMNRGYWKNE